MRSPRILTMLMFLLLSCQGDYGMAAPWYLEQIPAEERRRGLHSFWISLAVLH